MDLTILKKNYLKKFKMLFVLKYLKKINLLVIFGVLKRCLKDINLKEEMENLKISNVKYGANFTYNGLEIIEIVSFKKYCNSTYKFVFSKRIFNHLQ